jgi:hypothetical protein
VLESGKTYYLPGRVEVPEARAITVEAGAIVKVRNVADAGLLVHGRVRLLGTPELPVIWTSSGDMSVGEETPTNGTSNSTIELTHEANRTSVFSNVEFRYTRLDIGRARVEMDSIRFRHKAYPFVGDLSPRGLFAGIVIDDSCDWRGYTLGFSGKRVIAEADDRWPRLGVPYLASQSISVPIGASLSIDAGALFRGRQFDINGTFNIEGQPGNRVVLAGLSDNRHGGDVKASAGALSFHFRQGSIGQLDSARLAFDSSFSQDILIDGGSPRFRDTVFDFGTTRTTNMSYPVILVRGEGAPSFQCFDMNGSNTFLFLRNENAVSAVDAVDGYWLHPDGPLEFNSTSSVAAARKRGLVNAVPHRATRTEACSTQLAGPLLFDVDGDGAINPQVDGLLVVRYMGGLRGDDLTDGLLQPGAIRTSAESLEAFLADAMGRGAR